MDQLEDLCCVVLHWCVRPTEVTMDQLEDLWDQAAVTQLVGMLDVRQPSNHLLQPTERIKAEMAELGMPQPRILGVPCCQAHRLLHLQVEQVQPVLGPLHLGKKALLPVPDPEDAILDQYLAAVLIQLANADDA